MHAPMSATCRIVVLVAFRWTRGHHDHESAELAATYLAEKSGLSEKTVARALKHLMTEGVLVEVQPPTNRRGRVLSVQTDATKWGKFTPAFSGDLGRSSGPPKDDVRMTKNPVRESAREVTTSPPSPVRESTPGVTSSPPKNNRNNASKKQEHTRGVANFIGGSRAQDLPDDTCEAYRIVMDKDAGLAAHVDPTRAETLFWEICETYRKFDGGESCAARMPICADGAAELRKNCTNARNPEAYVRKLVEGLKDGSTDLIGKNRSDRLWALTHRARDEERPDNIATREQLEALFN